MIRLLNEIKRILQEREQAHIGPDIVLRRDVHIEGVTIDDIDRMAKDLEEAGMIHIGPTLNDYYYKLVKQEQ